MAGSLSEEWGPFASGSSLLKHAHPHMHTLHLVHALGVPAHHLPFSPFSLLPSTMLSSPAVLIHRPSQELSYPSGQVRLQLGGERDGGKKKEKW